MDEAVPHDIAVVSLTEVDLSAVVATDQDHHRFLALVLAQEDPGVQHHVAVVDQKVVVTATNAASIPLCIWATRTEKESEIQEEKMGRLCDVTNVSLIGILKLIVTRRITSHHLLLGIRCSFRQTTMMLKAVTVCQP